MTALLIGIGLGAFVAAQPGPVTLLIVRTIIRSQRAAAVAMAGAVAVVDLLYAGLGAAGAAPLVQISAIRLALGVLGGAVLVGIGLRTVWSAWRFRAGFEVLAEVATPRRAFLTGFAATASNPLTIASWASIFAAASVAGAVSSTAGTIALVGGVGLGSLAWGLVLTVGAGSLVRHLGERWIQSLDVLSGAGLIGFGGLLGGRVVADSA